MKANWIQAISNMTFGIYILTTSHDEIINGMVASWVSMVSYEPPLIMVAIHPNRFSHELLEKSRHFALNIISQDQKAYLSRFKGPDPGDKFEGVVWTRGQSKTPILPDCIGYLECKIIERYKPGNHTLFIGHILDAKSLRDDVPLSTLDYDGVYLGKD